MKKIYSIFAVVLLSVSLFASQETVPTETDLAKTFFRVAETASIYEITFGEMDVAPAGTLDGAVFTTEGSEFSLYLTDKTDNGKIAIDANVASFGTSADDKVVYTHRLKSGGSSSEKNAMTLYIPAEGQLRIAARTGNNSDTQRELILIQDEEIIYQKVVQEADTIPGKIYPYVNVDVKQGELQVCYTNGMNFYSFAFADSDSPTPEPEHETFKFSYDNSTQTAELIYDQSYTELVEAVIPSSVMYKNVEYYVTSIGDFAFYDCSNLTSVTIPTSIINVGMGAFVGCSGLTAIMVINGNAIYDSRNNCNAIIETATNTLVAGCQNTIIPTSVKYIGDAAFAGCSSLTSVAIPNSITSIGNSAFEACTGLTSVEIPNNVKSIGSGAFQYCSNLASVTIPNSVTSFGDAAFYLCGLTSVTNYATTPQEINNTVFYDVNLSACTLYVWEESLDLYKAAAIWREFGKIDGMKAQEGMDEVQSEKAQSTKVLRNGNLYILSGDKTYNVIGQEAK